VVLNENPGQLENDFEFQEKIPVHTSAGTGDSLEILPTR